MNNAPTAETTQKRMWKNNERNGSHNLRNPEGITKEEEAKSEMSEAKSMIDVYHLDTGSVKCNECGALWRVYDKDLEDNRAVYGFPQYCMYCGKRMTPF